MKDLLKFDRPTALRIVKKIKSYTDSTNTLTHAKQLSGILENTYRYRIGDYRAIFEIDDRGNVILLTILHIGHRRDIYGDNI